MIDTDRLHLRPFQLDDFEAVHASTASNEMRRYLSDEPLSRELSFRRFLAAIGGWTVFGFGTFAVIERASGDYVGSGGLFRMERDLGPDFDKVPESGWIIGADRWGQGYAGEAMAAAHAWFDGTRGVQRTTCMIVPGNTRSERIAARLGYQRLREADHCGTTVTLYERNPSS